MLVALGTIIAAAVAYESAMTARRGTANGMRRSQGAAGVAALYEPQAVLGEVLGSLATAGVVVLDCAQQRSELEESFLRLTTPRT